MGISHLFFPIKFTSTWFHMKFTWKLPFRKSFETSFTWISHVVILAVENFCSHYCFYFGTAPHASVVVHELLVWERNWDFSNCVIWICAQWTKVWPFIWKKLKLHDIVCIIYFSVCMGSIWAWNRCSFTGWSYQTGTSLQGGREKEGGL